MPTCLPAAVAGSTAEGPDACKGPGRASGHIGVLLLSLQGRVAPARLDPPSRPRNGGSFARVAPNCAWLHEKSVGRVARVFQTWVLDSNNPTSPNRGSCAFLHPPGNGPPHWTTHSADGHSPESPVVKLRYTEYTGVKDNTLKKESAVTKRTVPIALVAALISAALCPPAALAGPPQETVAESKPKPGPVNIFEGRILAPEDGHWGYRELSSRAGSIYSGTNQIQRNIISERVLGLPRR